MTTCLKCEYTRQSSDDAIYNKEECPNCGVIYSKMKKKLSPKDLEISSENTSVVENFYFVQIFWGFVLTTISFFTWFVPLIFLFAVFRGEKCSHCHTKRHGSYYENCLGCGYKIEPEEHISRCKLNQLKTSAVVSLVIFFIIGCICMELDLLKNSNSFSSKSTSYNTSSDNVDPISGTTASETVEICKDACFFTAAVGTQGYRECVYCCTHECD
jgi:hypothetical protein